MPFFVSLYIISAYLKGLSKYRMAFFFSEYLFFCFKLKIITFFEQSDDVIGVIARTVQYSIKNISREIKAFFFKLGIRTVHHKRSKMTPVVPLL